MRLKLLFLLGITGLLACNTMAAGKKGEPELRDRESEFYRMVTLPTPKDVQFEAGALAFFGRNRLTCSTRIGDIWIADGVLGDAPQPKWTIFARGLHEVLGLAWRDGWLYATQRGEVTRLKDSNGDGRADVIETFCDDWGIGGDYHEYAFGSKFDHDGNMFVVLCLTGSFTSENLYRGWCLKIPPNGKAVPFCPGIRSPGGIGLMLKATCSTP